MKGKIVKRVGEKGWKKDSSSNEIFFVSVEMDNGDKGQILSQTSGAYKEGEEIEYDLDTTKGDGKHSIKIKKPFSAGGFPKKEWKGQDVELMFVTTSYSYAKDLLVGGKIEEKHLHGMAESIATKMQSLHNKLKANKPADASV